MQSLITLDDVGRLDPYRLPRHVIPKRYRIALEPDLVTSTFDGRVEIEADVVEPTRFIVLNALDLAIERVLVDDQPVRHSLDPETERLIVHLTRRLDPGSISIDITFSGILNDKLRGFYRSTYKDSAGVSRVVATSQMQSTDCRRAFPCFDEPDFKAVFAVTLIADRVDLAISNGPEIERRWVSRRHRDKLAITFADTMPMSSYLVAFVVGPLEVTQSVDVDGVPLRIVHVPGKGHLSAFGLDVAAASLRWFVEYYGIPYPDSKIDLIALPDFAAGAMENVGCITFRENLLLVDATASTHHEQQIVADVVSHELAHMWFGDLVTMRWWNGIWLNEAFATFMEVAAVDAYRPDWSRWANFSLDRSAAFDTDSLTTTRPIEFEVRSPQDCEGMFDVLTYEKGGALLRMLEQYLGPERFRAGIRAYLRTHAYGNTETSDLWDAIEGAVADSGGEPVRAMMDSWIWQAGYPLVRAELERTGSQTDLVLSQTPFGFPGPDTGPTWLVPVHVKIADRSDKVLLEGNQVRIPLGKDASAPIIVNAGGHGFFRVDYSPALLSRLRGRTLAQLGTVERYTLVDDAWNAVVAGRLSSVEFLSFLDGFVGEREFAVWQCIATSLRSLGRLVDDSVHESLAARFRQLAAPALADIGWDPVDGEGDLRAKLRGLLVSLLAINGHDEAARATCRHLFEANERDPHSIHPELAAASTTVVAATGSTADYERLLARYLETTNPQEQLRYLYALCEFDDSALIARTCDFAMSAAVKNQNAPFVLARSMMARRHGSVAWSFVKTNWDTATAEFPSNTIIRMVDPVKLLNKPELLADVQSFFDSHPIPQAAKILEQILERQRVNTALRTREEPALTSGLQRRRGSALTGITSMFTRR